MKRSLPILFWASAAAFGQTSGPIPTVNFFSHDAQSFKTSPGVEWKLPFNAEQHTFLFGPEIRVFRNNHFTVKVWARGGEAKRFAVLAPQTAPVDAAPPAVRSPFVAVTQSPFTGANGVAGSFGGNVEYRLNDHVLYRIVQSELLVVRFKGSTVRDERLSTGVQVNIGKP